MRKEKDWNWTIPLNAGGGYSVESASLSVLLDIRDELKIVGRKLSALECGNFLRIPTVLDRISANTRKPKRRRAKK